METVRYDDILKSLKKIVTKPVSIAELRLTLLDVVDACHEKDWVMGGHRHPWFEFNYVVEGAVYTTFGEEEFLIRAGECFLVPPGVVHSHRHCNNQGDDGFCVRFQLEDTRDPASSSESTAPSEAQHVIRVLSFPRPFAFPGSDALAFAGIAPHETALSLQAALLRWCFALFELLRGNQRTDTALLPVDEADSIVVNQTLLYLKEYYASSFKVEDIARSLHISYRHLARIFKRATGMSIIETLNDIRVQQAKRLLHETKLTLREVAERVGFQNEFYLSKVFHRYTYQPPTKFRHHPD